MQFLEVLQPPVPDHLEHQAVKVSLDQQWSQVQVVVGQDGETGQVVK